MAVVNGFAGMRDDERGLVFDPILPEAWMSYRFQLRYHGRLIEVHVQRDQATYHLLEGDPLEIITGSERRELTPARPRVTSGVR